MDISPDSYKRRREGREGTNSFEETRDLSIREKRVHPFEESSVENVWKADSNDVSDRSEGEVAKEGKKAHSTRPE